MNDAQRRMIVEAMPLAEAMAVKYRCKNIMIEDLRQAAYLAMSEAALTYDPNRGVTFGTYAFPYIREALRREVALYANPMRMKRRDRETMEVASMDGGQGSIELQSLTDGTTAESQMLDEERWRVMDQAMEGVPLKEQMVLCALFGWAGDPECTEEVAQALEISVGRVLQLQRRGLNRLERALEQAGVL